MDFHFCTSSPTCHPRNTFTWTSISVRVHPAPNTTQEIHLHGLPSLYVYIQPQIPPKKYIYMDFHLCTCTSCPTCHTRNMYIYMDFHLCTYTPSPTCHARISFTWTFPSLYTSATSHQRIIFPAQFPL